MREDQTVSEDLVGPIGISTAEEYFASTPFVTESREDAAKVIFHREAGEQVGADLPEKAPFGKRGLWPVVSGV